jgi:hypothetical protein
VTATATISHTSLPSHTGPIVRTAAARPPASPPTAPWSTPTPKSKPSSRKKPVHRTTRTMNQKAASVIPADPFQWVGCGSGAAAVPCSARSGSAASSART